MEKIELHLHIEGAAPPAFIRRLADEKGVRLDGVFDDQGAYSYTDFQSFLDCYTAATAVLKTAEDYARLITEILYQSVENGVIYTEIFMSPDFCGGRDLEAWKDYLAAMEEAAQAVPGIHARFCVTAIRHLGPEAARQTALCAAETVGNRVTGFGMAGDETIGRATDFAWAFDCAREAGLGLTCHAGEFGGPDSIRDALTLRPSRIGHGVRAIEDPALVEALAASGIVLEVCPLSNIALGVFDSIAAHPIDLLRQAGVRVTVSTDDPPFFRTTMTREYDALGDAFGWGAPDFAAINRTAAQAAFCDEATRAALLERFPQ